MPHMRETLRETFWVLALAVIVLFAFFAALGAFSPTEALWLTIIVAALCGGALLGVLGALLAIPVAAGLLLLYEEVLVPRQSRH